MTNTNFGTGWFSNRSWHDRQQDERLEQLQGQLSSQRKQERRLKSELDQVRATVAQRLDRLTAAFEAFVELSDLRDELGEFGAARHVRTDARQVLGELADLAEHAAGRPAVDVTFSGEVADVPGYWLPPALSALVAFVRAEDASQATAVARERDAGRTDLFLCLSLLLAGRTDAALEQLEAIFTPTAGDELTVAQRQLWVEAAAGTFGEAGRLLVAQRLHAVVAQLDPDRAEAEIGRWRATIKALPIDLRADGVVTTATTRRTDTTRNNSGDLMAPIRAAVRLEAMRTWCEKLRSPPDDAGASAGSVTADESTAVRHRAEDLDAGIIELLQQLVDEGSGEERPLLERAAHLRPIVEGKAPDDGAVGLSRAARWDAPAGHTLDLLRADVENSTEPARQQLALPVAAPLLSRVADHLVEESSALLPDRVEFSPFSHTISVTSRGVELSTLDAARTRIEERAARQRFLPRLPWLLAGVAVLSLVLGLSIAEPVLAVIGLAIAGGAIWYVWADRHAERQREAQILADVERLRREVDRLGDEVPALYARAKEAALSAPATRAAIEGLLTPEGRAPAQPLAGSRGSPPRAASQPQDADGPPRPSVGHPVDASVRDSEADEPGDEVTDF